MNHSIKKTLLLLSVCLLLSACSSNANDDQATFTATNDNKSSTSTLSEVSLPSDFCDGYELADFDKFNSPASENGLRGTPIYINGTLEEFKTFQFSLTTTYNYIVRSEDNNLWYAQMNTNMYAEPEEFNQLEGSSVVICAIYDGFSEIEQLPTFTMVKMFSLDTGEIFEGWGTALLDTTWYDPPSTAESSLETQFDSLTEKNDVWNENHSSTIGTRKSVHISKNEITAFSETEFYEYILSFLDGNSSNWFTIIFEDNTGIQFPSCMVEIAIYGVIDKEGRVIEPLGYIKTSVTGNQPSISYEKIE